MAKAKVFISHSSRADPFAQQVRTAVTKGLGGYEVLVDMDAIPPGSEWASVLYHWLAQCHAAVILLNRDALNSTWVRREVNILLWRRALGSTIKIIPAIIGDLSAKDIKAAGFAELEPFQFVRLPPSTQLKEAGKELAAQIVNQFASMSVPGPDDSPMGDWIKRIAFALGKVQDIESLVAAARKLQVEENSLDKVRIPDEGCTFLAHQMLARGRRLDDAIEKIAYYIQVEWLSKLIDQIGATWVDGEAARALLTIGDRHSRTAILNASYPETGKQYIDRAFCYANNYNYDVVSAVTGEAFIDEFEELCCKAVENLLTVPGVPLEKLLPAPGKEPRDVLFLIVDPKDMQKSLVAGGVRRAQNRFPWLNIVLLAGDATPTSGDLTDWQLADAIVLSPPLMPEEELSARVMIANLARFPKKFSGKAMVGVA